MTRLAVLAAAVLYTAAAFWVTLLVAGATPAQATTITLGAAVLLAIAAACRRDIRRHLATWRHGSAEAEAARIAAENEAIRLANDDCQCTVRWDNDGDRAVWTTCGNCASRVGKHEALWSVPLDDRPAKAIVAVVTDLKRRQK